MATPLQESKVPVVTLSPLLAHASPEADEVKKFLEDVQKIRRKVKLANVKDCMCRPDDGIVTLKFDMDAAEETKIQINVRYSEFLKRISKADYAQATARLTVFVGDEPGQRLFQCEFC
jgi:hypothetical protein